MRTPARRALAAPTRALAEAIAAEWNAQTDVIDPARMPLTRLANAVIDAVADKPAPVADEIAKYLGSDLLCYRADAPAGLVERQARAWDPVLAWARDQFGARFVLAQGVVHVAQPREAIAAVRAAIPAEPWRLGALSVDHDADRLSAAGAGARAGCARRRGGLGGRACRRGLADVAMGPRRARARTPRISRSGISGGGDGVRARPLKQSPLIPAQAGIQGTISDVSVCCPGSPLSRGRAVKGSLMPARVALAAGLVEKPDAPLGIVDESFKQAGGRHIIVLVACVVRFAHCGDDALIVLAQVQPACLTDRHKRRRCPRAAGGA